MSLLFGPDGKPRITLTALWKAAQAKDAQEADVVPFWQHLLARFEFGEEYWVVDAEMKPEPTSRRRVDRGVRFFSTDKEFVVLLWIEAKKGESEAERKLCEKQALQACRETLASHKWQPEIYALTTLKTKAKAWSYAAGSEELVPMHDAHYIEAHSNEGYKLSKCFERMKKFAPVAAAAAPELHVPTAPAYSRTAYGAATQHYHPPTAYSSTAYGAPSPTVPSSAQYVSNPIFPRDSRTQTAHSESLDPWTGYTEVVARRDPRPGEKGLLYGVKEGWKAFGPYVLKTKENKRVFCSTDKKLWVYEENIQK